MSEIAKKKVSYEDLYNIPENHTGEIILGELEVTPKPSPKHNKASLSLGGELTGPFQKGSGDGPGGWIFLNEQELAIDSDILVPDVSGWKRERLPTVPETNWIEIPPDWLCEILSPSTARLDRIKKMPIYASHGVKHIWLLDPIQKTLEVFELHSEGNYILRSTHSDDDKVRPVPFEQHEIDLKDLWFD